MTPHFRVAAARARALHAAAAGTARIIVASAAGLLPRISPPERMLAASVDLRVGAEIEPQRLADLLVDGGFTREDPVDEHGAFAIRGGIVDVFPAGEKEMVRSMLSESLRAVISQTLLKRTGGGRIAAHEIMIGTAAIRNLIREGKIAQMYSAIQTGAQQGMQTLDQCLADLVAKGVVSKEEARYKASNKDSL